MKASCPVCASFLHEKPNFEINAGNFDNDTLYPVIRIVKCENCCHVFNLVSPKEWSGLGVYYSTDYSESNLVIEDQIGDRPGSVSPLSRIRHDEIISLFEDYLPKHSRILDVGCAMGGMLLRLQSLGYSRLFGVDVSEAYLRAARSQSKLVIEKGAADSLPFSDGSFDLVVIDQVVEHLIDPRSAFRESARVLVKDGYLCVGVPDAARYGESEFFDFYWFLMREHIQHFTYRNLVRIARSQGFEPVKSAKLFTFMNSDRMRLPNMNILFQYTGVTTEGPLEASAESDREDLWLDVYLDTELARQASSKSFISLLKSYNFPLYIWGIGREFLYLSENTELMNCNVVALIDKSSYKRTHHSYAGKRITDDSVLADVEPESILLVTAPAHFKEIASTALLRGFSGKILDITEAWS